MSKKKRKLPPRVEAPTGSPIRRNREERRSASVYRVESLFGEEDSQTLRIDGEVHHIEGEIDSWLVHSVPETTSDRAAAEIKNLLQLATNRPVLIITHNTQFMRAVKLSASEAAKVIKRAEDAIQEALTEQEEADVTPDVRINPSDGGGSGSDESGDSNSGTEPALGEATSEVSADVGDTGDTGEETQEDEEEGELGRPETHDASVGSTDRDEQGDQS